ncbi:MAG TPA: CocE/NonD family hydrolase [Gemmatimonadales bacterium]|nr:CocE/NonD family hydrolase [Gemmatimonadales bacterium]
MLPSHRLPRAALLLCGLGLGASPLAGQTPARVDSAIAVPMRDGIVLRADLYRPAGNGRYPVLVYRTPYGRAEAPPDPLIPDAVGRGYAVLLQDVRGRHGSEGTFDPYRQEGRDGYDTIEWAARQAWSDGRVGTFGLSYPGAVQWLAAVERPPSLRAMVPAMTFSSPESFWYSGGVWDGSWLDWTWLNIAPDLRRRLGTAGPSTDEGAARAWERRGATARRYVPRLKLPDFAGVAPWYYEWMRHPPGDPWWSFARLGGRYGGVGAAVLNLSGWFDEMYGPIGAVENYAGLVAAGRTAALVLGPWTHGVGSTERSKAGEREFGSAAALDYRSTVLDWMDRYVKGESRARPDSGVRVFVMGLDRWRSFDRWPVPGTRPDTLQLAGARDRAASRHGQAAGRLVRGPPLGDVAETLILSDPAHPVTDPFAGSFGAHDYRALVPGPSVAVFETPPFVEPLEIIGRVAVELAVSASVPDFDLWVQLLDVAPDGTAWSLSTAGTALQRASYRDGGPERRLVKPGETVWLRMDRLVTANRFLRGHRLRVVITPSFAPLFSINPQTGEQELENDRVRKGEIRIRHGPGRESRIVLPRVPVTGHRTGGLE